MAVKTKQFLGKKSVATAVKVTGANYKGAAAFCGGKLNTKSAVTFVEVSKIKGRVRIAPKGFWIYTYNGSQYFVLRDKEFKAKFTEIV